MVSLQEWDLSKLPDAARRRRLLHPPSAECLLTRLVYDATHAAEKICLTLAPCATPGYSEYSRLHTQLPVNKCTYDLLFNGRSGYRAQYYLSSEEGNVYNRQIMDALAPVIRTACTAKVANVVDPDLVQLSLRVRASWLGTEAIRML